MSRWRFVPVLLPVAAYAGLRAVAAARGGGAQKLDCGWPVNMAHRGASARAPENTMEAFRLAVEGGAGGLETDVHMTRDGGIVAIHDETVDRTTEGEGPVREMALNEVKRLDAGYRFSAGGVETFPYRGGGVRVPELAEVLGAFPGAAVNVDIKVGQPGIEEGVLEVIREAGAEDRVLVVSEWDDVVRRFRRIGGEEVRTGASRAEIKRFYYLHSLRLEGLLEPEYAALQVPAFHGTRAVMKRRFARAAHAIGVRVDVWTIDDPGEMERLLDLGADVIMTNRPDLLAEVLRDR